MLVEGESVVIVSVEVEEVVSPAVGWVEVLSCVILVVYQAKFNHGV